MDCSICNYEITFSNYQVGADITAVEVDFKITGGACHGTEYGTIELNDNSEIDRTWRKTIDVGLCTNEYGLEMIKMNNGKKYLSNIIL